MRLDEVDVRNFLDTLGIEGYPSDDQSKMAEAVAKWLDEGTDGSAWLEKEIYPKNQPAGTLGLMSVRTNLYLQWEDIKKAQFSVLVMAAVGALSGGPSGATISAIATELTSLWRKMGRLSEDEAEAVRKLVRLLGDEPLYGGSVRTGDYLESWPTEEMNRAKELLRQLEKRGVIHHDTVADGWTFVR